MFKDNDKNEFFKQAQILFNRAESEYKAQNEYGMVTSLIQLINLSLKVPNMTILKNVYYALALYFEHTRDYPNAIHAYTKLRGAAEGDEDYEG